MTAALLWPNTLALLNHAFSHHCFICYWHYIMFNVVPHSPLLYPLPSCYRKYFFGGERKKSVVMEIERKGASVLQRNRYHFITGLFFGRSGGDHLFSIRRLYKCSQCQQHCDVVLYTSHMVLKTMLPLFKALNSRGSLALMKNHSNHQKTRAPTLWSILSSLKKISYTKVAY